jgi:signal transduction histidine kinase
MIGLYVYAAAGTIGPAEAKQDSATVNADIGAQDASLGDAFETEVADTFVYQASDHRAMPLAALTAPGTGAYAKTDAALAAFEAGAAKAGGDLSSSSKRALPGVVQALSARIHLRQEVQAGDLDGLTIFEDYIKAGQAYTAFSTTLANPDQTLQLFDESEGLIDAGDGTQDVAYVATLLGGVLAGGGFMTPAEYQEFEQLYNNQQLEFGLVNNEVFWQVSPDPYWTSVDGAPPAMNSPIVQGVLKLEQEVLADGSSRETVRLPITPTQVQDTLEAALSPTGPLQSAENIGRVGITAGDNRQGDLTEVRLAAVGAGGLIIVILSALLLLRFGARVSRELTGLRNAARMLSGERLPSVVRRLRAGDEVDVEAEAPSLNLKTRTKEVTETADAFSAVQHTAIEAAVEQATLRKSVSNVFRSLARRNQSLVQRQLRMLDEMERGTQDPDALAQLFRLDHLTTRMRRQAEGLIILSGSAPSRRWRQPVSVVEALRGAISEIEDYVRVDLVSDSPDYLTGAAVADVTHLLAELIENAVVYSPPATRVAVRSGRVANGYVIEIEDRGLGIPPAARDALNERLAQPPDFDLTDSDQLGLFVVSRLAIRNGVKVSLRESGFGGTTAIALLPSALIVTEEEAKILAAQGPQGTQGPHGTHGTGTRGAIGVGHRPTEEDRAMLTSRRAPRLDRPAAAAHDEHDMGDGFGSSTYGAGAPGGAQSFGGGAMASRGEPASAGSFGGSFADSGQPFGGGSFDGRPSAAESGFGGGAPSDGGFGGGTLPSRGGSSGGSFGRRSPNSGPFGSGTLPTRDNSSSSGSFDNAFGNSTAAGRGGSSSSDSFSGAFGGSAPSDDGSFGGGAMPSRGDGGRGAFGSPAPFQDAPAARFQDAPAARPFESAGDGGGLSEGDGPAGLPKRQKMASLAPQLRESRPQDPKGSMSGRSPEQARALLSSIQRGLRTGRDSGTDASPGAEGQAGNGDQADPGYSGGADGWNA